MIDLATLGLAVDSKPVERARDELGRFAKAAGDAEKATDRLVGADGRARDAKGRYVKTTGEAVRATDLLSGSTGRAAKATDMLAQSANSSLGVFGLLKTALIAVGGAFSAKAIMDMADGWTDLSSRVALAAGSAEKGVAVMDRLSEMARRTYSSLGQTADSYLLNATALKELGYSTQKQLDFTEALNNALVVSGAKGDRAASVMNAVSKAMAGGKLQGDDLNTILQTGGRVASALAEGLGVGTNALRKMGAEGKLTSNKVLTALLTQLEKLREEADGMPATVGDAFTLIGNSILRAVGVFDQANGISGTFADGLIVVADNMGRLLTISATVITAYGTLYVGAMVAARLATMGLTGSLGLLRAALVRTGIGAVVVALGEVVYQLMQARDASDSWGEAFGKVAKRIEFLLDAVKWVFLSATDAMESSWYRAMANILKATGAAFGGILQLFGISAEEIEKTVSGLLKKSDDMAESSASAMIVAGEQFKTAFSDFKVSGEVDLSGDGGVAKRITETSKDAERAKKAYDDLIKSAKDRIEQMELEEQLVGKTGVAADTMRMKLELLQKAQDKGRKITPEQVRQLEDLAAQYGVVASRVAELQMAEQLRYERAQMFRSPTEQRVHDDLRSAGLDVGSAEGQRLASQIRLNEQLAISKDLTKEFAGGFLNDIMSGTSAVDALINAFQRLADKLIDMALDTAINGLFGNLMGAVGGTGGGFVANTTLGSFLGLADGGPVSGPGTGTSDSIMARLSNGEFVVNSASARLHRPLLEAINDNKAMPAFRDGGSVGNVIPLPTRSDLPVRPTGGSSDNRAGAVQADIRVSVDENGNLQAYVANVADRKIAANNKNWEKGNAVRTANGLSAANGRGYFGR